MRNYYKQEQFEHESEFTGLKGKVLKYVGSTYAMIILSQFLKAFAMNGGAASSFLYGLSIFTFIFAFVSYPAGVSLIAWVESLKVSERNLSGALTALSRAGLSPKRVFIIAGDGSYREVRL